MNKDIKSEQSTEYLELEGQRLYWGRELKSEEIQFRKFFDLAKKLAQLILFITAVFGVLALSYHLWLIVQTKQSFLLANSWQGRLMEFFWWSMLADMFLFYQMGLDAKKMLTVIKKSYDKSPVVKKIKSKPVEISGSFTAECLKIIDQTFLFASRQKKELNLLFLFNQLLAAKIFVVIFGRLDVSVKDLQAVSARLMGSLPTSQSTVIPQALNQAYLLAYENGRSKVEVTDLLQSVVMLDKTIQDILLDFKVAQEKIENVVKWANINKQLAVKYRHYRARAYFKPKGTMDRAMTALATPALDSFGEDLTQAARAGYLPLCIAREKELVEIFQMIEGGKNSVVLVGLPGVGKSNLIEGIANLMVAEEVPALLKDKRLVSLSIPHLVAGASKPNELQERIMVIMNEILRAGNIILHIDDIHNLVGLTSVGSENIDLASVFAKFLSQKSVITIATTNPQDYKQLEGSPLGQLLEKADIAEPEDNQAIQMIEAKVGFMEGKHQIFFTYDALEKAVKLSRRYIPDLYLPDKALRILEEAAMMALQEKGKNHLVAGEDVAKVISRRTSIPLTEVSQAESEKLLNLEERIHQRMVGQEEAVSFVASALRRARAELRDTKKPIVNLLFLGPTGVGKTELAKTVAQVYFGAEEKMVRLDMSEYQEQKSLTRLIGDLATKQGGLLTEAIRKQPFSLLLLDEIEKAHPDILNVFLQVMDDGRLTDAMGRTVDFTNCIIIATSNASANFIQDAIRVGKTMDEIKNQLLQEQLRQYFKPEFLNRFDGIVIFKPLTQEEIEKIAVLQLDKVKKRLEQKGIFLEVTAEAVKELSQIGFDPTFGARPLRRVIQERVDNALANFFLTGKITRRDKIILEKGGNLRIEKAEKY